MRQFRKTGPFQLIILAVTWVTSLAQTVSLASEHKQSKCELVVTTTRKSGTVSKRTYHPPASSKAECQKLAKLYETNFNPNANQSIRVIYQWSK